MIQDDGRYPLESAVGDQHLADLIDLLEGSDTCELKLTVPDSEIGSVGSSLGFDVLDDLLEETERIADEMNNRDVDDLVDMIERAADLA